MARPRQAWAGGLLSWSWTGALLTAEVSRAKYFIRGEAHEVLAHAELRELGAGRRRVEVGSFASVTLARAACERDAQRRLQRDPAQARGPVSVAIAPAERRRQRREVVRGQVPVDAGELRAESERLDAALRAFAAAIGEEG